MPPSACPVDRYTADFDKAHELISAAEQQARQRAHLAQALVSLAADPGPTEEVVPKFVELRWRPGDHQAALTVSF